MRDIDETIDGFDSAERHPLELLADEFSAALRDGSNPSIEEYADRVPSMRDQAVALLQSILMFEQVSQQEASRYRLDRTNHRFSQRKLELLGDFKILREIGRGGMGIIYEAEQLSLKRRVALKVLGPGVANSQKQLERFRRESEAVARLHHTNIVPVFGVGTEEGVHYFAMQLIDGKPLSTLPDLTFHQIARIGLQATSALAYAHEHGVLHRDIKPSNLLLDTNGELWVTDFGLAKLTDSGELTQDGDIMGTLKYMAPEQLDGRSDARTDVYSLGLTLYELATRQPAFDTSKSLADRIRNYDIVRPRTINPAIPRNLETIILKATARDAHARYQSAAEFGEDLRCFIEDRPIAARRESAPERLGRWMRRNPIVAGSLALTLLVLVATSIVSGLGYWTTQQALNKAEKASQSAELARVAAEKSRAQAEANLNVATTAFDAIFDNVAKRGVPQSLALSVSQIAGEVEDDSVPLGAPQFESRLTTADAELLARLLDFYREFAKQNSNDLELQTRIARAYRRSGQIQQRLGEIDEAIAAYDVALTIHAEQLQANPLEKAGILAIAQILNDRGLALFTTSEFFPEIVEHHHRAAGLLKSQPELVESLPEFRFEIARSLDLAGSMLARRGVTNADVSLAEVERSPDDREHPRARSGPFGFRPPRIDFNRRQQEFAERDHRLPAALDPLFASLPRNNVGFGGDFAIRFAPPGLAPPGFAPPGFGQPGFGQPGLPPPAEFPQGAPFPLETPPGKAPSGEPGEMLDGPRGDTPNRRRPDRGGPDRGGPDRGGPDRGGPNFSDIARLVEAELNEASELLAGLCSELPQNEEYQLASAQVNRHRMQLFLFTGRGVDSQAAFEIARAALGKLTELHPHKPQYMFELADTLSYASSRMESISTAEEEKYLVQAIRIGEQLCEAFPSVPEYLTLLASSRDKFGAFARRQERWKEAEVSFVNAADGMLALREQFPSNSYYQLASVLTLNNLAMLYLEEKSGLGSRDHWLECRNRLAAALDFLSKGEHFRDPFSERLSAKSRTTLSELNRRLHE